MRSLILVLSFLFSSFAYAAKCPVMAKNAISSSKTRLKVNAQTYRTFYGPLKHYRENFPTDFKAYIEEVKINKKGSTITGYEVFVTDGGDESTMRYVLNANKKIIVIYWYNQSPFTYWYCGQDVEQESEYTEDGSEII